MSWMKRPQGGTIPPTTEHQSNAVGQPYGNQQNMYPNYQGVQQQQMWPMPQQPPQYNPQQYGQVYQQKEYNNSSGQYYQQPQQMNPNYTNQNYENVQRGYQQNYYHPSTQQQNFTQNEGSTEAWDNWDWGWEDSSKQNPKLTQVQQQVPSHPQVVDNANIIEESFVPSNNWNWSTEEKREEKTAPGHIDQSQLTQSVENENRKSPQEVINQTTSPATSDVPDHSKQDVRNLSDREAVKELPNLPIGKRFHLENLTPQWSIESQMSQDSSDGPLTNSDGKYRSENASRNSSKDSPGPTTDSTNFNYTSVGYNETPVANTEWSTHTSDESFMVNSNSVHNKRESHDELLHSMQDMNLGNHELVAEENKRRNTENVQSNLRNDPPVQVSQSVNSTTVLNQHGADQSQSLSSMSAFPSTSLSAGVPPVPLLSNVLTSSPVLPPTNVITAVQPSAPTSTVQQPSLNASLPPPVGFPQNSSQNPFKQAGPFSHKNITKVPSTNMTGHSYSVPGPGVPLSSPSVVNQFVQQEHPVGYGANLETTPDNSERPDQPQIAGYRNISSNQQLPDNLEIAPQNDRNEYLQTAHLSSGDFGENTDFSRSMPTPSGPRRMGVGQQETEYGESLNISGDEPPPGLSRMVPGQQTEIDNIYNQPSEDFMDRHIDGQPTDNTGRPYRQADGQQTLDTYNPAPNRSSDRRPIGLDRMVPGEPSIEEYNQYQATNYSSANDQRVVTGVDRDFPIPVDVASNIREQNLDGSDYSEPPQRNTTRNIIGVREANTVTTPDYNVALDDQQREVIMEGENLQDLNVVSSNEIINVNTAESNKDINNDRPDSVEYQQNNSRKHSINRVTSGEDSERDRNYKASPRKDRDKAKGTRDRDTDRDKDGRYSRGDRKHDRDDRRGGRDERRPDKDRRDRDTDRDRERDRRGRGDSPDGRRHRRSTRSRRYETEDTDYYSDRERERRRHREGSYTSSKPPRPDDKDRRYEERDRGRRYNTIERDRRYDDERDGASRSRRSERQRDRFERRYRDIDPSLKYGPRRDDDDRRKVVTFGGDIKSASAGDEDGAYSPGSRPGSREATVTDEDLEEPRRHQRERRPPREQHYYDGYGAGSYADGLEAQRRQYAYYERLRRTDPAAYMRLYKHLMDPSYAKYYDGYGGVPSMGYETRTEDRGSVHSGRSSTNGLKHTDTELTTDMSLNLQLEETTARSERMTPFKYATSHVKGTLGGRWLVLVRGGATATLLPLRSVLHRHDPAVADLAAFPGPLVKGVSHKSRVVEYCLSRARGAAGAGGVDPVGYALVWQLLALMLRQNGMVVGSDIAELLMNNVKEFEYKATEARRGSASSRASRDDVASPPLADAPTEPELRPAPVDEREALDRLRELLLYGNRQEAIEWAMQCGLWGHALQLANERRTRAAVAARFVAALPPADPLHTLYHLLAARTPPAATCVTEERWGDWRPHAAIVLANGSSKPDQDRRTLLQLGDSLGTRGLPYSAQFCYVAAGERPARHPLAPLQQRPPPAAPRLSLLLADPRVRTLPAHAAPHAIFATEVYEYALSLSQEFILHELVVYKLIMCARLVDAGMCERALSYAEQAARALTADPRAHSPALAASLAALADRLKYVDPALSEEGAEVGEEGEGEGSAESSPRHQQLQWLRDVQHIAHALEAEASQQSTPQHRADAHAQQGGQHQWPDQTLQQQGGTFPEPVEEVADYAAQYQLQQEQQQQQVQQQQLVQQQQFTQQQQLVQQHQQHDEQYTPYGDDWQQRAEDTAQTYADPYWQQDSNYYDKADPWGSQEEAPAITMPGAAPSRPALYTNYDEEHSNKASGERDTDTPQAQKKPESKEESREAKAKGGGWLGGILTKLSLRPPNQMILPDDKNPTVSPFPTLI